MERHFPGKTVSSIRVFQELRTRDVKASLGTTSLSFAQGFNYSTRTQVVSLDLSILISAAISRNFPSSASMSSMILRTFVNRIINLAGHSVESGTEDALSAFLMERTLGRTARDPHLPLHHAVTQEMSVRERAQVSRRIDAFTSSGQ